MTNPSSTPSPPTPPSGPPTAAGIAIAQSAAAKDKPPLRQRSPILAHLRSVILAGLLTAIPLFITIYIVGILYNLVTAFTKQPADWLVDLLAPAVSHVIAPDNLKTITTPFFAVLISLVIVYVLGLLGTFFIGRQILAQVEHLIENLPLIKGIYGTTKQVISVFRQGGSGQGFQRVVLVQFPRQGTWTIAFVTKTIIDTAETGAARNLVCCFIPMTPNPTAGFFQMFPESDVRSTDWSVDMGIKIILSGGLLAPPEFPPSSTPNPDSP